MARGRDRNGREGMGQEGCGCLVVQASPSFQKFTLCHFTFMRDLH